MAGDGTESLPDAMMGLEIGQIPTKAGRGGVAHDGPGLSQHIVAAAAQIGIGQDTPLAKPVRLLGSPDGGPIAPSELDQILAKHIRHCTPMAGKRTTRTCHGTCGDATDDRSGRQF